MPKVDSRPPSLKPYIFHGVDLGWRDGDTQAIGDCPFCGREGKFTVNVETGQFRCFICAEGTDKGGGNPIVFIRLLWKKSDEAGADYQSLAIDRRLEKPETLMVWEAVQSCIDGCWMLPGYSFDKRMMTLYRYSRGQDRSLLLPTPNLGHHLFGAQLYSPDRSTVILCEGPWDGMALWEVMSGAKETEEGLAATSNIGASLLSAVNVLATPTCSVFSESWLPLFAEKRVILMYDNDHPRIHPKTGKEMLPAGLAATQRTAGVLSRAANPPAEVLYLKWGELGYDPNRPSGFDVRDFLCS